MSDRIRGFAIYSRIGRAFALFLPFSPEVTSTSVEYIVLSRYSLFRYLFVHMVSLGHGFNCIPPVMALN
eukprot:6490756-Amphidinium_carterae.2